MTLRYRLGLLLLAFLLLVTVSVAATGWALNDQREAALVINLAGRQRMLIQQITSQALQIEPGSIQAAASEALSDSQSIFDQTLTALISGGKTTYRPGETVQLRAIRSDAIQARLAGLRRSWDGFQTSLQVLQAEAPHSQQFEHALRTVQVMAPELVEQADEIVRLYETETEHKSTRLQGIQAGFFASAVALLVSGVLLIRRSILAPLDVLTRAAETIGRGDLSTEIPRTGPQELVNLTASLDEMRGELRTLRDGLEARVAQRTRELAALAEVIREISSRLDLEHVLQSVTAKARELLDSEVAFLCLLEDNRQELSLRAFSGPAEAVCQRCTLARNPTAEQVLRHPRAMICEVGGCATIAERYRTSHLAASLRIGERVIGALCVSSQRPATYSQDQARVLTELANSTAIALENARLYEQSERAATLEERQRIAAEMHDGLAQTLSYIQLKADRLDQLLTICQFAEIAPEIGLIRDAVERASVEVRQSIASLRASPEPERTLQAQLTDLLRSFPATCSEEEISAVGLENADVILPAEHSAHLLRMVGEALQNARRHAGAAQITLSYEHQCDAHRVVVQDNGRGFNVNCASAEGHFGLNIMRARAARIGARLDIESAPGCGARITLTWPSSALVQVKADQAE